jgi:hypothetical protein
MESQNQENPTLPKGALLFRFNGVPVVVQPGFWPAPVLLTGLLAWASGLRKPERSWLQRLGLGLLAMPVALFANIGHAMAHTVSARLAGAPMDEILLSSGLARTLYENNAVSPQAHIRRSLGGPIFSLAGFTLSLLWRRLSPHGSLGRDLADASLASQGLILIGSLAPLPVVDGGVILKWKFVAAGQSPDQADQAVRKASLSLGAALLGLGALLIILGKRRRERGLLAARGAR